MKNPVLNLTMHSKKLKPKPQISPYSVGFQFAHERSIIKERGDDADYLQELADAISLGDDSTWRMWR